jgi:hypothetical protein
MFTAKICVGQIGIHFGEVRRACALGRVHHVCTENADVTIWLPLGGGYDPRKTGVNGVARAGFASRSNPL